MPRPCNCGGNANTTNGTRQMTNPTSTSVPKTPVFTSSTKR